jgi:hypothetical protein
MAANIDELLPSAKDCMTKIAVAEAEEAAKSIRRRNEAEEKKALLDQLTTPSGVADDERMKRAASIIKRAVDNGRTEVEVGRFPNQLFTDRGRATNQREPGWEDTLTGLPMELYQFWQKYLRPRGYKVRVQIVDFPAECPATSA